MARVKGEVSNQTMQSSLAGGGLQGKMVRVAGGSWSLHKAATAARPFARADIEQSEIVVSEKMVPEEDSIVSDNILKCMIL